MAQTGSLYWLGTIVSRRVGDAIDKLLLLALADHVDENDTTFVSIKRLAFEAECSERAARAHLQSMEARGWISRTRTRREDGSQGVYVTTLRRGAISLLPAAPPAGPCGSTSGTTSGTQGAAQNHPTLDQPNSAVAGAGGAPGAAGCQACNDSGWVDRDDGPGVIRCTHPVPAAVPEEAHA